MKRIIEVSERGCQLSINGGRLQLLGAEARTASVPINDIASLLLTESAISLTGAVLSELTNAGAAIVSCGRNYLPDGIMLPSVGSHDQSRTLAGQIAAGKVLRKQLWQALVRRKIQHQAVILKCLMLHSADLEAISRRVNSGDSNNKEAYAAALFWKRLALFPVRDRMAEDANRLFNYTYMILFSAAARALSATGLHPGIGLHHHNQYNAFCLASDLMEPFRVLAEDAVISWLSKKNGTTEVSPLAKHYLLDLLLTKKLMISGHRETLFSSLEYSAVSLRNCLLGKCTDLILPEFIQEEAACG